MRHLSVVLSVALLAIVASLVGCDGPEPGPAAKPVHQSRAKVRFDRADLIASLDSLVAWHDRHGAGRAAPAAAGPGRTELDSLFAEVSFVVPEELLILWQHPGGNTPGGLALDGVHRLLSVRDAKAAFDSLRADAGTPWRHNWIPVMRGHDEWIAIESSRRSAPAAPVLVWRSGSEPRIAATNLTLYFEVVVASIEENGTLAVTPAAWEEAHRRLDPDVDFVWKEPAGDSARP